MRRSAILAALAVSIGISLATAAEPDQLAYVPSSTKKVCRTGRSIAFMTPRQNASA